MSGNRDWCLGQTVRQMDTDQVVDLVMRLTDERDQARDEADQQRVRAELAEQELDAYREFERKLADAVVDERRAS